MEERSLRISGADKTFFNKITNTITKILIPTKVSLNSMRINSKRNSLLKAYDGYNMPDLDADKKEALEQKYEQSYTAYLEVLDKYVLDSIYKKVKNDTASEFEKQALSKYYSIIQLKESEYIEYKYRKQKYLLELDNETVKLSNKDKLIDRYDNFYIQKMDQLYKAILKNYSIKLADTMSGYDSSKDWIYTKIFYTLEEYIQNVLTLKINISKDKKLEIEYEKYEKFTVGKLDTRDTIEKNMVLLEISRKLFTHSLPLVVAEQCYTKLLKDARTLVQDTKMAAKRERAYSMLINLMEDYNIHLLSTKVYWEDQKQREEFKKFWNKYQEISKLKETDFIRYMREKEVLLIKEDMEKIQNSKQDYTKIKKYYKRKLVDYGAMRQIRLEKLTNKRYIKNKAVVDECTN